MILNERELVSLVTDNMFYYCVTGVELSLMVLPPLGEIVIGFDQYMH